MGRRSFLVTAACGLTLGFFLPEVSRLGHVEAAGGTVNTWLSIGADESITLTIGSSEMGQGSFSGLAQVLAEDLMVDYARVITVQGAPTLSNPAPIGTAINTVGSSVIRTNFWKMRDAAAAARGADPPGGPPGPRGTPSSRSSFEDQSPAVPIRGSAPLLLT